MAITKGTYTPFAAPAAPSTTTIATSSFDSSGAGLLVSGVIFEGADTTAVFTDNKSGPSNTWQTAIVNLALNEFSVRCAIGWCVPANVGTGHVITCTTGAARTNRRINALNVNGNFSAADALITSANLDGSGTAVDAGTLVTTTAAILCQVVGDNAGQTFTQGTGWTKDSATAGSHFQSRVEAAGGTFDPAGTLSAAYDWTTVAMAFKETAAAIAATGKTLRQFPNKGPLRQSYGARTIGFKQGIVTSVSPDVTVTLTGQSAAFTPGTLTPSTDVPLVGQAGAFATGTLTPNSSVPLVGQAAAFTPGTLVPSSTIPLVGQTGALTPGVVTAASSVALTGQGVVSAAGTLTPSTAVVLAGQRGTFSAGTLTATGGTSTGSGTGGFSNNVKFLSPVGNILSKQ